LNIKVGRRHAQFLTNFITTQFQPFTHQEQACLHRWQMRGTGFQHIKELALPDFLLGIAPVGRRLDKMPVVLERHHFQRVGMVVSVVRTHQHFTPLDAQNIDHLVLENAGNPGF